MEMENMENQNTDILNQPQKSKGIKILVLILALVLIGYLFFRFSNQPGLRKPIVSDKLPENYHNQVLRQNTLPVGFSENLIVQTGKAEWQRAEDTIVGDGKRLKITEFIYRRTEPAILAPIFEKNFKNEKWLIDSKRSSDTPPVLRFFDKEFETATLAIIKINEVDSLVNITISTK